MKTSKIIFILSILLVTFGSCSKTTIGVEKSNEPNIIYILADDMGVNDLGCYGQQLIKTPHIDKMASEGMRFTNHYAGSTVCAPSRCTLMTGLHTGHGYIKGNFAMGSEGNLPLPDETLTVAENLKNKGYKTGIMGKWGLGGPNDHGHPNNQGFDYSYCYLDQRLAHEYYPDHLWKNKEKIILNNQYSHDIFASEALNFILDNKDNPFFLYLPFTIPHGKFQIPDDSPYTNEGWTTSQKNYAAMITRMDSDIGEIFALLDSLGLDENTIVFFASDNGGVKGMNDFFDSNAPFRGNKSDLYEGGIRAPLIARWPGKILNSSTSGHISAFWDMLPTFCEIAGTTIPETDGISFLTELLGQTQKEHDFLYWEYFDYNYGWKEGSSSPRNYLKSQAVRLGDWKGVRENIHKDKNAPIMLFDLSKDIGEQEDVATLFLEKVEEIKELMIQAHIDSEYFKK